MVSKRKKTVQYILMVFITLMVVFPFLWMLVLSFKTNSEILSSPLSLPKTFNFDNYRHAMETLNFPKLYGNTIFVCVTSLVAELIITFCSSFVLARMEFKNEKMRKMLYGFLIMGLSISPFILLLPVYKINVFFGFRGKIALIFPYIATSISFNTLLLVGYLKSLPVEIDEAAIIDGCNIWDLMVRIILPMTKPVIATVVIFNVLYIWNEFPFASVMLRDVSYYTYDDHMRGGCFSGSAIEHDGRLFLMYTGVKNDGNGFEQTQCIAYSEDGIHFEKYEGNPVLTPPEGVPADLFRDPKVWKHGDTYYMVCGASRDHKAQALLYRSDDMIHWTFFNVLAESRGEWGYMWECPDFYRIGDKYVLMVSPMGAGERTVVYMVGDFDYATGKFSYQINGEIDWGHDYYAPQSFVAPDGRRLIVGWANCWDWMPFWKDWGPAYKEGWCGSFNIVREVQMTDNGTLRFLPIKELESLRTEGNIQDKLIIGVEWDKDVCLRREGNGDRY